MFIYKDRLMIVIPVKTDKQNSAVSPLFGKAKWFALVKDSGVEMVKNSFSSGSEVVNWLHSIGAKTLIASHLGARPFELLNSLGIEAYFAGDERIEIEEVLQKHKNGELARLTLENFGQFVKEHHHNEPKGFGVNRSSATKRCC